MCKPFHRLLLAEQTSHGVEKELYDLYVEKHSIGANHQDSWGKLFKSKSYVQSQVEIATYDEKIRKVIVREFPGVTQYHAELIGRKGIIDVSMKRGQRILIKLAYGD